MVGMGTKYTNIHKKLNKKVSNIQIVFTLGCGVFFLFFFRAQTSKKILVQYFIQGKPNLVVGLQKKKHF